MDVRRGRTDEWRTLREFRLRALAEDPDAFGSTLARERSEPEADWQETAREGAEGVHFLIAVTTEGDDWTGMAWGHLPEGDLETANLYAMWVDPEHRGRGNGRALVEHVAGWARARGAARLQLRVSADNAAGAGLYRSAGFLDTGTRHPLREGSPIQTLTLLRSLE